MSYKVITPEMETIIEQERANGCIGFVVTRKRGKGWAVEAVKYCPSKFKAGLEELDMTLEEKADALGIDSCLMNLKAKGRAPITREDMENLRELGVWK